MSRRFGAVLLSSVFLSTCGADTKVAPAAEQTAGDIHQCRSFEAISPNLLKAINTGKTESLKRVVEGQLLKTTHEGDVPPANDVLRAVFMTLTKLAEKPPEVGAGAGLYCLPLNAPPPLTQANELCEMRRSLDILIHQGKGRGAGDLVKPQLGYVLGYMTGQGNTCKGTPRTPVGAARPTTHYEVANIFSRLCGQTQRCQLSNGLDLAIGFTDFLRTTEGQAVVEHINTLATRSSVSAFLDPSKLTEDQFVAIGNAVIPIVQAANANDLDQAFNNIPGLSPELKTDLQPLVNDMKILLNKPELIGPVRNALDCVKTEDTNRDLTRMIYRLVVSEQCSEFGLTKLTQVAQDLKALDPRGDFLFVIGALARAVRNDETAVDSAAKVCQVAFSTVPQASNGNKSNAELLLPTGYELIQDGIIDEIICAADTLLFGCAGGSQPACR